MRANLEFHWKIARRQQFGKRINLISGGSFISAKHRKQTKPIQLKKAQLRSVINQAWAEFGLSTPLLELNSSRKHLFLLEGGGLEKTTLSTRLPPNLQGAHHPLPDCYLLNLLRYPRRAPPLARLPPTCSASPKALSGYLTIILLLPKGCRGTHLLQVPQHHYFFFPRSSASQAPTKPCSAHTCQA